MDKLVIFLDRIIDFLFLRSEYEIKFPSVFLKKILKIVYVVVFVFILGFKFLVFCWDNIAGSRSLVHNYFNFFIVLMLLVPVGYLVRFFVMNLVPRVKFRYSIERDLRNFLLGNKFVDDRLGYKPTVYFSITEEFLIVRFRLDGHIVTKKFDDLGKQLSSMFVLALDSSDEIEGYYCYQFRLRDIVRSDVSDIVDSDEIRFIRDSIVLNSSYSWNYRTCPHGLICGVTGAGKTFLFAYFIIIMLKVKALFRIVDPKGADLYFLEKYFPNDVFKSRGQALKVLREACELIDKRMEDIRGRENYTWGEDYSFYDIKPFFLIFDEAAAFSASLKGKEKEEYKDNLCRIIMEGRQAGVFVIIAMQRPDADFIPTAVRDQLGLRVALGYMSDTGYKMVYGDDGKGLNLEDKKAGFYMDLKMHSPKEFYTPYLDINFIDELEKLIGYKKKVDLEKEN